MISEVAGKRLVKRHNLTGPQGVRGRNSDNTNAAESAGLGALDPSAAGSGGHVQVDCIASYQKAGGARRTGVSPVVRFNPHTTHPVQAGASRVHRG